jgi:hypothetical protein
VYRTGVISSLLSRVSAAVLLLAGVALLFAPDVLLPALVPGFPPVAAWLGQLLGAAWLAVAALNWLQRAAVLGGIYGRPVVLANVALYFISALSLLRALLGGANVLLVELGPDGSAARAVGTARVDSALPRMPGACGAPERAEHGAAFERALRTTLERVPIVRAFLEP